MKTDVSELQEFYTLRGEARYLITLTHAGLGREQDVKGPDARRVIATALSKAADWDRAWAQRMEREQGQARRQANARDKSAKAELAAQQTREAEEQWQALGAVLAATLEVDDALDWATLERHEPFAEPRPRARAPRPTPPRPVPPPEPEPPAAELPGCVGQLLDVLQPSRVAARKNALEDRHQGALAQWDAVRTQQEAAHQAAMEEVSRAIARDQAAHARDLKAWEARKQAFEEDQRAQNEEVASRQARYESCDPDGITDYCSLVLERSKYPDWNSKSWALEYRPDARLLVVDYVLPNPSALPRLKAVRYVGSRDAFEETTYTDAQVAKAYDGVVYQMVLRSVHELFEADTVGAIEAVAFNGRVHGTDRATGKPFDACIVSLQVSRAEFLDLHLAAVDPKACFKKLKGVGSAQLHALVPVPPIVQLQVLDKRFVDSYAVRETLDEGENLASMDWEDFEHLIRELFELEFAANGGEVRVTRASRDGGIDVVVFDADPLRGGKIVIQAKRYTNTVSVSAVRDLYGALQHEGANKGILVTTASFGPDAYEFAKDKPLTLLSGSELLHLLQKHGHRVRINLDEARASRGS